MTNILHKRSSTPGAIPGSGDLTTGEIALNTADGTWFIKKADNSVVDLRKPDILDGEEIDMDAVTYISAVEAADTTILEQGVRVAIYNLIVGLKYDQLWDSIGAMCLLAGPRTVAGCMIPLCGPAPTNYSFVNGDLNRETGLLGDGAAKYINTNYANNVNGQNDQHAAVWVTATGNATRFWLSADWNSTGGTGLIRGSTLQTQSRQYPAYSTATAPTVGFVGLSRISSTEYTVRHASATETVIQNSSTSSSSNVEIFRYTQSGGLYSSARIAYYSIGAGLDLAKLEARISTYLTTIAAVL